MSDNYTNESMLDLFLFESNQNIEQLEKIILSSEKADCLTSEEINEIFRIMHTIKGSSAMMFFYNISSLSHAIEDLFYYIRENKPQNIDYQILFDLVLEDIDFIKTELEKITNNGLPDGDATILIEKIKSFLSLLKRKSTTVLSEVKESKPEIQHYYLAPEINSISSNLKQYKATIYFNEGCMMENLRAYNIIHNLKEIADEFYYLPENIIENDDSSRIIQEQGFQIYLKSDQSYQEINDFFQKTIFLKSLLVEEMEDDKEFERFTIPKQMKETAINIFKAQMNTEERKEQAESQSNHQSIISVNVGKLDKLMDLVGEMVITEAMVTQNPDLKNLELNSFHKAARQLHKITSELQDMVMSIRMVPLSSTFQKMHRIVRDMSKKLDKEVQLKLIGEETEVDKNIIEHISDPLMHLVRNSIDHGIEGTLEREASGKSRTGVLTLEAKNAGSDVLIIVGDDGKGLNKEAILKKAFENELIQKTASELTDKEIYNLILLPGFSTKDTITEFSGRGVGMDVVTKSLEAVGGVVSIDSIEGKGTTTTLKIPLTLAIIDGMNIRVGSSRYTLPTSSIKESFRPKKNDIIKDPDGNEMIMVRGQCYPILRLHDIYGVNTKITCFTDGILIMVEQDDKSICLFADELIGQQQVVVKALPNYIKNTRKIAGLAGCTLLGDGNISLILDIGGLLGMKRTNNKTEKEANTEIIKNNAKKLE